MSTSEPATKRAIFYQPEIAFNRPVPPVPAKVFSAERAKAFDPATPTGFVPLDQGEEIGCKWPATTPALLARYLVLRPGELFSATLPSGGDSYFVVRGKGHSECEGETIDWGERDVFCLPGAVLATHVSDGGAILLLVNDEPLFHFTRARPDPDAPDAVQPTLFPFQTTMDGLREVHGRNGEQLAAGKSTVFVTQTMADRRLLTRTVLASLNSLEPGGDQRPHKHSSAALTLSVQGDGVYSMVDGERVEWQPDTVIVTPPGAIHSHHNRGSELMLGYVTQDTGLHTELRTTNFAWTDV